jgi:hypothetical protein
MNIIWSRNGVANISVTLYESNITLNKSVCSYFENVNYVLLGLDKENRLLAIKPVTKESIDLGIYSKLHLHKISLGKSYGRISNKNFMKEVADEFKLDYTKDSGIKYDAQFDEKQDTLLVQL